MPALLALMAMLLAAQQPQAPDLFTELFAKSAVQRQHIKSLRGRFVETTTSTLLTAPLVARGTLVAAPPARLAMTYDAPEAKVIVVNTDRLVVMWPGTNRREELNIARTQQRVQTYFADAGPNELRKHFDVRVTPASEPTGMYLVAMTPKRKQVREGIAQLDIWVDRDVTVPRQLRMTFPSGDTKTIRVDDIEFNVPIRDDLFTAPAKRVP